MFGSKAREEKKLRESIPFNPEQQLAVIHSSICTGEKVAGFKDKQTGQFIEVMLIRYEDDLERFKRIYGIEKVETEY